MIIMVIAETMWLDIECHMGGHGPMDGLILHYYMS